MAIFDVYDFNTLIFIGGILFIWILVIFDVLRKRGKFCIEVLDPTGRRYTRWRKREGDKIIMDKAPRGKKTPQWQFTFTPTSIFRVKKLFRLTDTLLVKEDADDAIDIYGKQTILASDIPSLDKKTIDRYFGAKAAEHAGQGEPKEPNSLIVISILLGLATLAIVLFMAFKLGILGS